MTSIYYVMTWIEMCSSAMLNASPQEEAEALRLAEGVRQYLQQETKEKGCGSLAIFLCLMQMSELLKKQNLEVNCPQKG